MSSLKSFKTATLFIMKINKRAMAVALSCLILLNTQAVYAVDVGDFTELKGSLTNGETDINLTNNIDFTSSLSNNSDAASFADDYTVTGNNIILDGKDLYTGLRTKYEIGGTTSLTIGNNLTFQNFYFNNSSREGGAALFAGNNAGITSLNIGDHVTFQNNEALDGFYGRGGAVYAYYANTILNIGDYVTFLENTAGYVGGAVAAHGKVTIGSNALFGRNIVNGSYGGAIANVCLGDNCNADGINTVSTIIGANSVFEQNESASYAGAIANIMQKATHSGNTTTASLNIDDGARFSKNAANGNSGGAIYNQVYNYGAADDNASGSLIIGKNVVFENNTAADTGGAIYSDAINYYSTAANVDTTNSFSIGDGSSFIENRSGGNGGAIYSRVYSYNSTRQTINTLDIGDSVTFSGNTSGGIGGAINFQVYDIGGNSTASGALNITTSGGTTLFTNNRDSAGVNDIYLNGTDNAVMEVNINGNSGTVQFDGGIANASAIASKTSINKTNGGILTFGKDAINANFTGTFNQTGGTTNVYGQFFNNALDNIVSNSTLNFYREDSGIYGTIGKLSLSDSHFNIIGTSNKIAITDLTINGGVSFNISDSATALTVGSLNAVNATVNFLLPDTIVNNDKILDVSGTADITNADVKLGISGTKKALNKGESILLIDAATTITGEPVQKEGVAVQGLTLVYDYNLSIENNRQLRATISDIALNPQTKAFAQGRAASVAGIAQIGDLVARAGVESAVKSAQEKSGAAFFSGVEGGFTRYNTGSHINLKNTSLIAGVAKTEEVINLNDAYLTYGGSIEFGANWYDAYNGAIKGKGNNQYYGLGFLSRLSLNENYYGEVSLRGGTTKGDFSSAGMGQPASYDTNAPYWGGHMGAGYISEVGESLKLNSYAKYLYAAQNGESAELPTEEEINFKRAASGKIVLGERLSADAFYGGLAYEYEFYGAIDAEISAMAVDSPSIKGGSGMAEVGYVKDLGIWKFDAGLQGYLGKRKGIGGGVKIGYRF